MKHLLSTKNRSNHGFSDEVSHVRGCAEAVPKEGQKKSTELLANLLIDMFMKCVNTL